MTTHTGEKPGLGAARWAFRLMTATTNFITWGSTTTEDERFSASNVLLPELHNPRRCLRQPVLLVRDQPPQTSHYPAPFELSIQRPTPPSLTRR